MENDIIKARESIKEADRQIAKYFEQRMKAAEAVAAYLQQKLKINTGSMPLRDITHALNQKGVRPATGESFALLWQRLDTARFAPTELAEQSTLDLAAQALDVLSLIEEETK